MGRRGHTVHALSFDELGDEAPADEAFFNIYIIGINIDVDDIDTHINTDIHVVIATIVTIDYDINFLLGGDRGGRRLGGGAAGARAAPRRPGARPGGGRPGATARPLVLAARPRQAAALGRRARLAAAAAGRWR